MSLPLKVIVGSINPVKLEAVKIAFKKTWPQQAYAFSTQAVSSNVSKQPLTDQETITGALYRAQQALTTGDFGIGLEGGLQRINSDYFSCGWAVIINQKQHIGIGSSARIALPPQAVKLLHQGYELAEIDDLLFQTHNSGQSQGNFGLMTQGLITRKTAYTDACILALTRFTQKDLYQS